MDDPMTALGQLEEKLTLLETAIAPLLERTRAATMDPLGYVDKAKMDVLLAFAINNLVWIYLRSRGIDPETHEVNQELERIQTYYAKVRNAEGSTDPSRRIDVPVAERLIKHSLPSKPPPPPPTSAAELGRRQAAKVGRATRFSHIADGGEKLLPGNMDVDENEAAAENLLAGVEADIVADDVSKQIKKRRNKRRRE